MHRVLIKSTVFITDSGFTQFQPIRLIIVKSERSKMSAVPEKKSRVSDKVPSRHSFHSPALPQEGDGQRTRPTFRESDHLHLLLLTGTTYGNKQLSGYQCNRSSWPRQAQANRLHGHRFWWAFTDFINQRQREIPHTRSKDTDLDDKPTIPGGLVFWDRWVANITQTPEWIDTFLCYMTALQPRLNCC